MDELPSIVALFKDTADERLWAGHLQGIPHLCRVMAGQNIRQILANLKRTGIAPRLVMLSATLYPRENRQLVTIVRQAFPRAELLLIAFESDAALPLQPLLVDNVRHLVINHGDGGDDRGQCQLGTAVTRLVNGRPWIIGECLRAGSAIHEYRLASSAQKEDLIRMLEGYLAGNSPEMEMFRQRGALLADEMLENAMYGAPRGEDGGKIFRKGEERALLPRERLVFRFGFDGETLALEMVDNWGSLAPDLVMEYLARNQDQSGGDDDAGGRGLFFIWRFLDQMHVTITPGVQTTVGGHLRVSSTCSPEAPHGFHITTLEKENSHGRTITHCSR
jgi:hypothetical protein